MSASTLILVNILIFVLLLGDFYVALHMSDTKREFPLFFFLVNPLGFIAFCGLAAGFVVMLSTVLAAVVIVVTALFGMGTWLSACSLVEAGGKAVARKIRALFQ